MQPRRRRRSRNCGHKRRDFDGRLQSRRRVCGGAGGPGSGGGTSGGGGGGGGGGYAGGAGGAGGGFAGGSGAGGAAGGNYDGTYNYGGAGGSVAVGAPYAGTAGARVPTGTWSAITGGGGGGGSIGAAAASDLPVATTFQVGSGGGGGGGSLGGGSGGGGGGGGGGAIRLASSRSITITSTGRVVETAAPAAAERSMAAPVAADWGRDYLAAPSISISGAVTELGGAPGTGSLYGGVGGSGGVGRLRISVDPTQCSISGSMVTPAATCTPTTGGGTAGVGFVAVYPN